MAQQQMPVSALIRQGNVVGSVENKRKTKDEYPKQKDLEEHRKAGTTEPAMVDVETGRDINPHIPEFIEKTPWYVPTSGPTLKHPHPERHREFATINEWYPKGPSGRVVFKYREGACENCGAMDHSKKDCLERPRANSHIVPDDQIMPNFNLNWDAERDRWGGFDAGDYKQMVVAEYEKMEETRKMIRAEKLKEEGPVDAEAIEAAIEKEVDMDDDIYAEDMAVATAVDMDSRTRITVRNLRIRDDTAKYLYNLNDNSAHYESRSMRENPFENMSGMEQEQAKFSGENFISYTGEVVDVNEAQVFAWAARCKGIDVHSLAEPTRLEALKREYEKQKVETKSDNKKELFEKYGGEIAYYASYTCAASIPYYMAVLIVFLIALLYKNLVI